jgi:ribosome recycling factor
MHDWKPKMEKAARHLAEQLRGIRSGGVDLGLVKTIRVECHGRSIALDRLSALKIQGDRIVITPFDRAVVPAVVKALNEARLSAYALNPETVCVSVPAMSIEQREEILRHVKKLGEEAKVAVRSIRQQARKRIESSGRGSLRAVQEATDAAVEEIESVVKQR